MYLPMLELPHGIAPASYRFSIRPILLNKNNYESRIAALLFFVPVATLTVFPSAAPAEPPAHLRTFEAVGGCETLT